MKNSLIYVNPSNLKNPEDADLGSRIGIALTNQARPGWHEIFVAVRGGHVTLSGTVATARERKLVNDVTSRVAGVLRIKDELKVDEKYHRKLADSASAEPTEFEEYEARQKAARRAEQFRNLPVVSESLEDLLASRSNEVSH